MSLLSAAHNILFLKRKNLFHYYKNEAKEKVGFYFGAQRKLHPVLEVTI